MMMIIITKYSVAACWDSACNGPFTSDQVSLGTQYPDFFFFLNVHLFSHERLSIQLEEGSLAGTG